MKVKLTIEKANAVLLEQISDVSDAESFGKACELAWNHLRDKRLARATSIGALYDELNDQLLDELFGARLTVSKA